MHSETPYYYGAEAAWKEDNRRHPNGEAFNRTIGLTMASPVSQSWKGYWQQHAS